ncbi:MAG TPA: PAS domain S-box protein, partial [Gemmataceae bacterium]|nr:PAS domain S-box protein [Gemmataceae bacterium]
TAGAEYRIEYRLRRHDGQYRWHSGRACPVRDPQGRIVRWLGTCTDIDDRKRAEEALTESEARYRDLFENANDVIYTLDLKGRITSVNRRAEQTFGYTRAECLGRNAAEMIPPEHHARMYEALRRKLQGETTPTTYEVEMICKNGRRVPLEISSRLIVRDGRPVGIQGIARDATERRLVEETLREADRRKDEFLAMLAHELRNPLAPIRNAVQVLKLLGGPEPTLAQARAMIDRQVAHMARLVDDLLDVSRITRGKILLRKEPLDLVPLVRAAAEDHRSLLEGTGLKLTVELPERPLWVEGDPTRLAQVVGNLLHNANKFTDPGGQVVVCLQGGEPCGTPLGEPPEPSQRAQPNATEVLLTVRDTGIGMGADILGRLFEPFSQADRSIDRSRGGLGLGLALVKGLAELHGGSVQAFSAGAGRGSEFTVHLPLIREQSLPEKSYATTLSVGRSLRVLVVEDNRDAAESLRMVLTLSGHRVVVAYTGLAGLEAARAFRPDVVLCDIGLPGGLDGYGVAQALRADPEQFAVPLIALSGYGQEEDQRKARQAGFDRYFTKPVDPTALARILELVTR